MFVIQTVVFRNCSARSRARAFQRLRLIKEQKKLPDRSRLVKYSIIVEVVAVESRQEQAGKV